MSDEETPRIPRKTRPADDPKMIGLWKIGRTIGKGRVRIARHSKTGQYAAIKIVSKVPAASRISLVALPDHYEQNRLAIEREIVVMKLIEHPNIMRLYDVWETSTELYLILEYVQGGELFEYLCHKGRLPTLEALSFFQQIISAVDYCHRFNIAHRDLKPENILLDNNLQIKIADFGMAAWQARADDGMLRTSCGSPHYAAPEIVRGESYNGSAADIWSCGIVLHALLAGRLPFDDEDCPTLLEKVVRGSYVMPTDIDPLAQDLISQMLALDASKRITMTQIQSHPFFNLQAPKVIGPIAPTLDLIARPIASLTSIDPEVFANLRTLWHDTPDEIITESLRNDEVNWQKGIYHLLVEYRRQRLENYDEEEDTIVQARILRRLSKRQSARGRPPLRDKPQVTIREPSMDSFPPRGEPPTPRRAARRSRVEPVSTDGSVVDITAPRSSQLSSLDIDNPNENTGFPAEESNIESPSLPQQTTPLTAQMSPIWEALNLPEQLLPELEDEKVQAFFNQLVNHLTVLQTRIGTPNLSSESPNLAALTELLAQHRPPPETFEATTSLPNPGKMSKRMSGDNGAGGDRFVGNLRDLTTFAAPGADTLSLGVPLTNDEDKAAAKQTTKPLTLRRKPGELSGNKENNTTMDDPFLNRQQTAPPPRFRKKYSLRRDKKVQIAEPSKSVSNKRASLPSSSPGYSDGGWVGPGSPRHNWLGAVFKFKPSKYTLASVHDVKTTRNECRRLLMGMNIRVILEDEEGPGVLRCRLEEGRDLFVHGVPSGLRPVKFRVEVIPSSEPDVGGENPVVMVLIQEKGSTESFKEINKRLQSEWTLDIPGSTAPMTMPSPRRAQGKFVEWF